MTVRFYRSDGAPPPIPRPLPDHLSVRVWRPRWDGLPPRGSRRPGNFAWWAFERLGLFARSGFAELSIWHADRLLHRLIVTPRWYRFPFMAEGDFQLGDLWTHPGARGQGLARAAVGEAMKRFGKDGTRFWYVVRSDNRASVRLIESCGFRLIGSGRRTRPLGLAPLGRFRLGMHGL